MHREQYFDVPHFPFQPVRVHPERPPFVIEFSVNLHGIAAHSGNTPVQLSAAREPSGVSLRILSCAWLSLPSRDGLGSESRGNAETKEIVDLGRSWMLVVLALTGVLAVKAITGGYHIDPSKLAKATRSDIAKSVVATGKVQPITKVELKSKASGIVKKLYVDINEHVHQGQVLAQLDQQEILAQVAAQKAQLAAAESNASGRRSQRSTRTRSMPTLLTSPCTSTPLTATSEMSKQGVVSQQALDNAKQRLPLRCRTSATGRAQHHGRQGQAPAG